VESYTWTDLETDRSAIGGVTDTFTQVDTYGSLEVGWDEGGRRAVYRWEPTREIRQTFADFFSGWLLRTTS
jgi:DNA gyrase inhibitor GyrI